MEIITSDNPAQAAGEAISKLLAEHQGDTLCLLSGGSALDEVPHIKPPAHHASVGETKTWASAPERSLSQRHDELEAHDSKNNQNECRIIFMMGDERGSREPTINNYRNLQSKHPDSWVTAACLPTVPTESETLEHFSKRISNQLDDALSQLRDPQIIYLMGIGSDGHTAGIFPLDEPTFAGTYERDKSIVPVHLEGLRIDSRASVTPQWILDHIDHIIGYTVGETKYATLESLKNDTRAVHERPAELWKLKSGSRIFTDQKLD